MKHIFIRDVDTNVIEGITFQTNGDGTFTFTTTDVNSAYAHGEDMCRHALSILHGEEDVSEQLLIMLYKEIAHEKLYKHIDHAVQQVTEEVLSYARHNRHMTFPGLGMINNFATSVLWDQEVWMKAIRRSSDVIATFAVTQTDITEEV